MKYWFKSSNRFERVWSALNEHDCVTHVPPVRLYPENERVLRCVDAQKRMPDIGWKYMWKPVHEWLADDGEPTDFATYKDALKAYLLCEYFECYYGRDKELTKEYAEHRRQNTARRN